MKPDDTGLVTDSAQFSFLIPECTNISVGYYREHTNEECLDIDYLYKICKACTKIDWESLPIVREINGYRYNHEKNYNLYDEYDFAVEETIQNNKLQFNSENRIYTYKNDEKVMKFISNQWIEIEKSKIKKYLNTNWNKFPYDITEIDWNGAHCYITYKDGGTEYLASRKELSNYIDGFLFIPSEHLSEDIF
jgi:hypothetical protein